VPLFPCPAPLESSFLLSDCLRDKLYGEQASVIAIQGYQAIPEPMTPLLIARQLRLSTLPRQCVQLSVYPLLLGLPGQKRCQPMDSLKVDFQIPLASGLVATLGALVGIVFRASSHGKKLLIATIFARKCV